MRKNVTNFILMVVRVSEIKDIVILALDKREMIFPFHVDGFQVANGNRGKIKKNNTEMRRCFFMTEQRKKSMTWL